MITRTIKAVAAWALFAAMPAVVIAQALIVAYVASIAYNVLG